MAPISSPKPRAPHYRAASPFGSQASQLNVHYSQTDASGGKHKDSKWVKVARKMLKSLVKLRGNRCVWRKQK